MKSARDIEREAAVWLARLDTKRDGDVPPKFQQWLTEDPRHRAAFTRLETVWRKFDGLRQLRPLDVEVDTDLLAPRARGPASLWTHALALGAAQASARAPVRPLRARWVGTGVVVTLIVIVAMFVPASLSWVGWPAASRLYETDVGGMEHAALEDGSVVELNTGTAVRVGFDADHRAVELVRGEALFEVAHDSSRPFEVRAGDIVARAVGTKFSVRRRDPGAVEVFVTEGAVVLERTRRGGPLWTQERRSAVAKLSSNQLATLSVSGERVDSLVDQQARERLCWTRRMVCVSGAPVREVIAELNRYLPQKLVLSNPADGDGRIGAAISITSAEDVKALFAGQGIAVALAPAPGAARPRSPEKESP